MSCFCFHFLVHRRLILCRPSFLYKNSQFPKSEDRRFACFRAIISRQHGQARMVHGKQLVPPCRSIKGQNHDFAGFSQLAVSRSPWRVAAGRRGPRCCWRFFCSAWSFVVLNPQLLVCYLLYCTVVISGTDHYVLSRCDKSLLNFQVFAGVTVPASTRLMAAVLHTAPIVCWRAEEALMQ